MHVKKVGILLEIAISSSVTAYTRVSGLSRMKFTCALWPISRSVKKNLDKLKHACYSESDHGDDRFRQGRVGTDCKPRSLTSLNRATNISAVKVPAFNARSFNALPLAA